MITINFFTTLRLFLKTKQVRINADEICVADLLKECERRLAKPFLHKLLDPDGHVIPGTIILVNGQNILHLEGVQTIVRSGADIALFPPGGGG